MTPALDVNYLKKFKTLKINMMMRPIITLCLLFVFAMTSQAQPLRGKTTPAKRIKVADEQMALNNTYKALELYEDAYREERDLELAYKVANLHLLLRDYVKAQRWYKRIVERKTRKKPNPFMPDARLTYGRLLKMNENYPDAKEQLRLYISEGEDPQKIAVAKAELAGAEMAQVMDINMEVTVEHGGKKLNSKSSEYSPALAGDDVMYFASMRRDKVLEVGGKKDKDYHSKIYTATKGEDGWGEATEAGGINLNREGEHSGNLALTKDGKAMYFTRANLDGNALATSQLYYSELSGDGWTPAKLVDGLNGDYIVKQPAVGELFGEQVIFFISNMDGGYGGFDIYYSTRRGDTYAPPVNLGDVVNSAGDEETPFYVDGNLYFSSDGHPGLGGFDIFTSEWNGSVWSKPTNMGKPYNSSVDDLYFSVDEDGYHGLLISNRPGTRSMKSKTCCTDIFEVTKEKVILDLNALTFADGKPLAGAGVQLIEMQDNTPGLTGEKTNAQSNDFAFTLKSEMAYMLIATKEGFFPDTLEFNTAGVTKSTSYEKKLTLKAIPEPPKEPEYETYTTNEPIELGNIFYDYDDDKILQDAEEDLSYLKELMDKYPDMVIELSSHTDARGLSSYNKKLSQRRATSAKTWLTSRGVAPERINDVGYGESQIRNKCVNGVKCSDDEHRFNRRTEFKIVAGPTSIEIEKKRLKKKG